MDLDLEEEYDGNLNGDEGSDMQLKQQQMLVVEPPTIEGHDEDDEDDLDEIIDDYQEDADSDREQQHDLGLITKKQIGARFDKQKADDFNLQEDNEEIMEYREAATASLITDFEPRKSIVAEVVADSNDEDNIYQETPYSKPEKKKLANDNQEVQYAAVTIEEDFQASILQQQTPINFRKKVVQGPEIESQDDNSGDDVLALNYKQISSLDSIKIEQPVGTTNNTFKKPKNSIAKQKSSGSFSPLDIKKKQSRNSTATQSQQQYNSKKPQPYQKKRRELAQASSNQAEKSIKVVKKYMLERTRSKESIEKQPGAAEHRSLNRASFKSLKCDSGLLIQSSHKSRSKLDDQAQRSIAAEKEQKSLIQLQQDQYSSHKVLKSGKHIATMHMATETAVIGSDATAPAFFSQAAVVQKRLPSKQKRNKGIIVSKNVVSSATVTQQSEDLQQQSMAVMSQKQTKSKARMIRNILQSSNLKTKPEQQQNLTTDEFQLQQIQQPQLQLFEPICFQQTQEDSNENIKIDEAFSDLFDELMQDATQPTQTISKVTKTTISEINLKKAQIRQRYESERQNLNKINQKFEIQQNQQIKCLKNRGQLLEAELKKIESRAQQQIDYAKSREVTRIWRNVNRLCLSWISSILVEAEKSRKFAQIKTKKSLELIVFTAQEFQKPKKVTAKNQQYTSTNQKGSGIDTPSDGLTQVATGVQYITRDHFGQFQTMEIYKFLQQMPQKLQFLINFHSKNFDISERKEMSSKDTMEASYKQNYQVGQTVLDFARQSICKSTDDPSGGLQFNQFDEDCFDIYPMAVISAMKLFDEPEKTFLEIDGRLNVLPSPAKALAGCHDLIKGQQCLRGNTLLMNKADSIVSNLALDVLEATSKTRLRYRQVYVCLKEAYSMDIELPKHAEMRSRINQNKAIGRVYEQATPIAQIIKKMRIKELPYLNIKSIKGLSQLKVEFQQSSKKEFCILAGIDLAILKQSKEFVEFFMPTSPQSTKSLMESSQGVSLYVIEQLDQSNDAGQVQQVRQLQPLEVIFLLTVHLRLNKPVKLVDFAINKQEVALWKQLISSADQPKNNASKIIKTTPESRNSITVGQSVQQEDFMMNQDDREGETSRFKNYNSYDENEKGAREQRVQYLIINERSKESGDNSNRLVRRYIVRTLKIPKRSSKSSFVSAQSDLQMDNNELSLQQQQNSSSSFPASMKETMICIWPNCMKMTNYKGTLLALQHAVQMQLKLIQQQNSSNDTQNNGSYNTATSYATGQTQNNSALNQFQQSSAGGLGGIGATRKTRPNSAYRQKQNNSSAHLANANVNHTNNVQQTVEKDKAQQKRIYKMRLALELDLADNIYTKFIKKGKSSKDGGTGSKQLSGGSHNGMANYKTRASWNMMVNSYGSSSQQVNSAKIGAPSVDASTLAPVLSGQIINPAAAFSVINSPAFFTRMCPAHQEIERFLSYRFNINLIPNGPLNPNAFLKGLRVFKSWRTEAKTALMNDLFITKNSNQSADLLNSNGMSTTSVMADNMQRIFNYACGQVAQLNGPDIVNLIQTLQQIPKSINQPAKFFVWMQHFVREMSPMMIKNEQFANAVTHFQFQLAPLSSNLKQVKLNEDFIVVELSRWKNNLLQYQQMRPNSQMSKGVILQQNQAAGTAMMTQQQILFLLNNFQQFSKTLLHQASDVIHKFTYFQQFIHKMNELGPQVSQSSQDNYRTPNQSQQKTQTKQLSKQQTNFMGPQKANLMPYATDNVIISTQGVAGPVKIIPQDSILFQSSVAQKQAQVQPLNNGGIIMTQQSPQLVQPQQVPAGTTSNFHASINSSGSISLEKAAKLGGSFVTASQALASGGQSQAQTKGSISPMQTAPTPLLASGQNTVVQGGQVTSTLDKITAIYGIPQQRGRTAVKDQASHHNSMLMQGQQQNASSNQQYTQQNQLMASDGFLSQKKYSHQVDQKQNFGHIPRQSISGVEASQPTTNQTPSQAPMMQYISNRPNLFEQDQEHQINQQEIFKAYQGGGLVSGSVNQLQSTNSATPTTLATKHQLQYSRMKQRSNRQSANQNQTMNKKTILGASGGYAPPQTAEQVIILARSPKKRILSKGGNNISATMNSQQNGFVRSVATSNNYQQQTKNQQEMQNLPNFLPSYQSSNNELQNLLPSQQSYDSRSQQNAMIIKSSGQLRKQDRISTVEDAATSSCPLTQALEDISKQPGKKFLRGDGGFQTQTNSFMKQSNHIDNVQSMGNALAISSQANQPIQSILPHNSIHQKQRAASAKKELIATYSSNNMVNRQNKTTTNMAHKQHQSMQQSSFGLALVSEQKQYPTVKSNSKEHIPQRFSLISTNYHVKNADAKLKNNEPLVPQRYQQQQQQPQSNKNQENNRSSKDWQQKNTPTVASALSHLGMQASENNKMTETRKTKARKDSSGLAASYATEKQYVVAARYDSSVGFNPNKQQAQQQQQQQNQHMFSGVASFSQRGGHAEIVNLTQSCSNNQTSYNKSKKRLHQQQQPPRAPPVLVDSRVNYQGGIRIINSVLSPSNVPRSAVTAKSNTNTNSGANTTAAPGIDQQAFQQPVRNITSAGQPQSSKQSKHVIQIQRNQMISNSSQHQHHGGGASSFQHIDGQLQLIPQGFYNNKNNKSSKTVTQQLLSMQKSTTNAQTTADFKAQHMQVTYANAMPRLASANAYLTKQSRMLQRPNNNLTGGNIVNAKSIVSSSAARINPSREVPNEFRKKLRQNQKH